MGPLDTRWGVSLVVKHRLITSNVIFLPTASAEADLELSAVFLCPGGTTRLKPMSNKLTGRRIPLLTKQVRSNISEAYRGSLRSGGQFGMPSIRHAAVQTRA